MPIIPDSPSVGPYMNAVATVTELVFKLAGFYGDGNHVSGQGQISLIEQITSEMDKLLTNKLYDVFYTQYKGTLEGLNIRYKEYKGTPEEKEWLNNIIEDSADLLGLVKQQFETELQNNHEHTLITMGLYADVCLFRATAMSMRKINYQMNRDEDIKAMLQECKEKQDTVIAKIKQIYDEKNTEAENCKDPEPRAGTIYLPVCWLLKDNVNVLSYIVQDAKKQRTSIETAISAIPQ